LKYLASGGNELRLRLPACEWDPEEICVTLCLKIHRNKMQDRSGVGRWFQIAFACVLIAAVAIICIAPAYSIQPTALRAWNSCLSLFAALCTLIVFAFAVPMLTEEFFCVAVGEAAGSCNRLRLTCTLLI
jgi:hypothetical protein